MLIQPTTNKNIIKIYNYLCNILHRPKRKMRILNSQDNCTITGLVVFDTI